MQKFFKKLQNICTCAVVLTVKVTSENACKSDVSTIPVLSR